MTIALVRRYHGVEYVLESLQAGILISNYDECSILTITHLVYAISCDFRIPVPMASYGNINN